MRVGLAFLLFGDEVIKGIFLYLNKIEKACGPAVQRLLRSASLTKSTG